MVLYFGGEISVAYGVTGKGLLLKERGEAQLLSALKYLYIKGSGLEQAISLPCLVNGLGEIQR